MLEFVSLKSEIKVRMEIDNSGEFSVNSTVHFDEDGNPYVYADEGQIGEEYVEVCLSLFINFCRKICNVFIVDC